jgi:cytochrome d ubiquinol oxidase subunit II
VDLATLPMIVVLIGLALYVVLGGADFGAALWGVVGGRGELGERLHRHAHLSMAPVWEANHVWLIFVLTVTWTAYPAALGSIASTLAAPLLLAGLGIIVRGAAYALGTAASRELHLRAIDVASAVASVVTPFALGAAIGGIASGRVPVGNAAGDPVSSWLNPTSIAVGVLAVANCAYLAAVFLAGDAKRRDDDEAAEAFRRRALISGALSGVLAVAGLVVLRSDARELFDDLIGGPGTIGVVISGLAGVATLWLVWSGRFETARLSAALAVAAIVAGWALAQQPQLLPGMTVRQAAAPHDALVAVLVAVGAGAAILFPSLTLLFRLALGGRLGGGAEEPALPASPGAVAGVSAPGLLGRVAVACLLVGIGLLNVAESGWAHAVGVVALLAFVVLGFFAAVPGLLGGEGAGAASARRGERAG